MITVLRIIVSALTLKLPITSTSGKPLIRKLSLRSRQADDGKKPQILPSNIEKDDLPSTFANYFKTKVGNLRNSASATDFELLTHTPDLDCPERLMKFVLS